MTEAHGYWPGILIAQATFVLATLSPGPAMLSTMGTSMGAGRKAGIALGLGIVTGSFCWAVLTAIGFSVIIAADATVLTLIRFLGSFYLLYLAVKAFRAAIAPRDLIAQSEGSQRSSIWHFLRGWGIHLTNPKAILAWIAIISLGLKPGAPFWVIAAILGGTMIFAVFFYTFCAVAFSTEAVVRVYGKTSRWIDAVLAAFFIFAALKLALQ
jgi:threonine efflux protein